MTWSQAIRAQAKLLKRGGLTLDEIERHTKVPVRTLQSWRLEVSDDERWSLSGSTEDAGLVLDLLAYVLDATEGRRTYLTHQEAEMAARIRRARPSIDSNILWRLVLHYTVRQDEKRGTEDLDAIVALYPDLGAPPKKVEEACRRFARTMRTVSPGVFGREPHAMLTVVPLPKDPLVALRVLLEEWPELCKALPSILDQGGESPEWVEASPLHFAKPVPGKSWKELLTTEAPDGEA